MKVKYGISLDENKPDPFIACGINFLAGCDRLLKSCDCPCTCPNILGIISNTIIMRRAMSKCLWHKYSDYACGTPIEKVAQLRGYKFSLDLTLI